MPELPDVVPGEPVESDWGNNVRDRVTSRYADASARSASEPFPQAGQLTWLDDPGVLERFDGTDWALLALAPVSGTLLDSNYTERVTQVPTGGPIITHVYSGLAGVPVVVVCDSFMRANVNPDGSRWFTFQRVDGDAGSIGAWVVGTDDGTFASNCDVYMRTFTPTGDFIVELMATINQGTPSAFNNAMRSQVYRA